MLTAHRGSCLKYQPCWVSCCNVFSPGFHSPLSNCGLRNLCMTLWSRVEIIPLMFYSQVHAPGFLLYSIGGNWYKECSQYPSWWEVLSVKKQDVSSMTTSHWKHLYSLKQCGTMRLCFPSCVGHSECRIGQAIQGVGQTELGTNLGKRPPASTEECAKQMLPVPAPGLQASWVKVCQKHYGFDLYPHS